METLALVGFLFLGLIFSVIFGRTLTESLRTKTWIRVSGVVSRTSVSQSINSEGYTNYSPSVNYRYRFADRDYSGRRIGVVDRSERHSDTRRMF
jgi:Protein of unknown function (DUF3592)